jgi:hypothetical protein
MKLMKKNSFHPQLIKNKTNPSIKVDWNKITDKCSSVHS